jgi:hypothetical protein
MYVHILFHTVVSKNVTVGVKYCYCYKNTENKSI